MRGAWMRLAWALGSGQCQQFIGQPLLAVASLALNAHAESNQQLPDIVLHPRPSFKSTPVVLLTPSFACTSYSSPCHHLWELVRYGPHEKQLHAKL